MNKLTTFALCLLATATSAFAWGWNTQRPAPPPQQGYYQPAPQQGYYQPTPQQGRYPLAQYPAPPPQQGYYQPAPPQHNDGHRGRHGKASHGHGQMLGEFNSGSAKEVVIGGGRSSVVIEVVSGSITINTVVLRRGGQKQSITVSARFNQGQRHVIPIDGAVTGIRISDGGKGRYRVYAQ